MNTPDKLAGVRLTASMRRSNMAWYFVVLWFSSMYLGVMNANQPFVLAEYLKIPLEQHGQVSGIIQACTEIVMSATVSLAGVLSDRIGRPIVYASGFALAALGVALYTHATSLPTLILYRVIFTVGVAVITAMLVTVLTDDVIDEDRGCANGYQGFIAGAGAIFTFFFLTALPSILRKNLQATPGEAGHLAYDVIAAFGLLAGGIAWACLARYLLPHAARDDGPLRALAAEAIGAARRDPGIALTYAASFVSRDDLAVAGLAGAIGVLVGTLVGGILTARVGAWAPFVMFAGFNLTVALWAQSLRGRLAATGAPALTAD